MTVRRRLRTLLLALGAALAAACPAAAEAKGCRAAALERLRAEAPAGFAIYRQISDKAFFLRWLECEDPLLALPTAVHESVHHVTAETDAFPLLDGAALKRPHEASRFFPPSRIAGRFPPSEYVATYLRPGGGSSATDFLYLLDELNAYAHDLRTALDLAARSPAEAPVDGGGLGALMAFVARYAQAAEESEPATWRGLREGPVAEAVARLWSQAEDVMEAACPFPDEDAGASRPLLERACETKPRATLGAMLGRPPRCPLACRPAAARTTAARRD